VKTWVKHLLGLGLGFVLFTFLSLIVVGRINERTSNRAVESTNRELATLLQGQSDEQLRQRLKNVETLRNEGETIIGDAWIVTETGEVIASASDQKLPTDWNLSPLPKNTLDVTTRKKGIFEAVAVTKLQSDPVRYMVLAKIIGSRADDASLFRKLAQNALFFVLWIILGAWLLAGILMFYYFRVKAAEAKIIAREKEHEKKRARILQELNHDLRTPLTSLRLLVDGIQLFSDQYDDKMREQAMSDISAELDYLTRLVQFLFSLSDMEQATYRIDFRRLSLQDLVKEEITHRQSSSRRNQSGVTWELNLRAAEMEIEGDRALLQRALRNALDNATKYSKEKITVELSTEGSQGVIKIIDDGDGPSATSMQTFGKAPAKVKGLEVLSPEKSFGLGSAIMVAITELHGGRATLSRATTSGGCQEIRLPLAARTPVLQREAGFGMLEVLISCSLLAIVGFGMMKMVSYNDKAIKKSEVKAEYESVRAHVKASIDCSVTLPAAATVCATGTAPVPGPSAKTFINVTARGGALLIAPPVDSASAPVTLLSNRYGLRASCGGNTILYEIARMKGPGTTEFELDPITRREQSWEDLFRGLPPPCQAQLSGVAVTPTPMLRCATESVSFPFASGIPAGTTVSCSSPSASLTHCSATLIPGWMFQCGARLIPGGSSGTQCQLEACPAFGPVPAPIVSLLPASLHYEARLDCCETN